jgi:hypothetical protein
MHEGILGSGGLAPLFLTSALDGGEWSSSPPWRLYPWGLSSLEAERPTEPVCPLWSRGKYLASARNWTQVVYSVARRYTDWTISAPTYILMMNKNLFPTTQISQFISMTKTNRLILFRQIIAVYCENRTEHVNSLDTTQMLFTAGAIYTIYRCVLNR